MRTPTPTPCNAEAIKHEAALLPEEWGESLITGIRWMSELVGIAGGDEVLPECDAEPLGKARILEVPDEVISPAPSHRRILVRQESLCREAGGATRLGEIPVVSDDVLHEIKSPLILQPGPAALTEGVIAMAAVARSWAVRDRATRG